MMLIPHICLSCLVFLVGFLPPAWGLSVQNQLMAAKISVVFPGDPGYAAASQPFNLRFTLEPAAVTFPATAKEVAQVVHIGGSAGMQVVARSGGHSYIANGLGGKNGTIVVDLKGLASVAVDSRTQNAIIGTGARLGDITLALHAAGRAMSYGTCAYVGVGGHATHGGFGFTSPLFGLALDNILSMTVVLANGKIVKASERSNSDLFWAMRGSGSSFGIATSIEFRTYPEPSFAMIFQYNWQVNYTLAAKALGVFQDYLLEADLPQWLGTEVVLTRGQVEGNISFGITGSWYGDPLTMNDTVRPLLVTMNETVQPYNSQNFLGNGTYIDNLAIFAGGVLDTSTGPDVTDAFYAKSIMTPVDEPLNAAARLAMMKYLSIEGFNAETGWFMQLEGWGSKTSAINAVPLDATSFGRRDTLLTMQFYTQTRDNKPPFPVSGFGFLDGLVGNITASMPPTWDYGAYANYIDDRLSDWQRRYYGSHYKRLKLLKKRYDPSNVFKFPVSIEEA